jgi:hypothetical protein
MPLPASIVDRSYRTEEVNLRPGGSTITVTAPSDNPFETSDEDIEIVTQDSGGMAGPDPRMRSKRVIYQGKSRNATKPRAVHSNQGFSPASIACFGDGDEFELGALGAKRTAAPKRPSKSPKNVLIVHSGMMPRRAASIACFGGEDDQMDGMAGYKRPRSSYGNQRLGGLGVDPTSIDTSTPAGQAAFLKQVNADADALNAQTAAQKAADQAAAQKRYETTSSTVVAGLTVLAKQMDAKSEAAKAAAAAAKATGDTKTAAAQTQMAQLAAQQADAARAKAGALSTGAKVGIGAAVLVAVGLVAFLMLRKKG